MQRRYHYSNIFCFSSAVLASILLQLLLSKLVGSDPNLVWSLLCVITMMTDCRLFLGQPPAVADLVPVDVKPKWIFDILNSKWFRGLDIVCLRKNWLGSLGLPGTCLKRPPAFLELCCLLAGAGWKMCCVFGWWWFPCTWSIWFIPWISERKLIFFF